MDVNKDVHVFFTFTHPGMDYTAFAKPGSAADICGGGEFTPNPIWEKQLPAVRITPVHRNTSPLPREASLLGVDEVAYHLRNEL